MDNNVVRSVNQGPMGPQGPVKVNNCVMNKEAGFEPVVRLFPHTFTTATTIETEVEELDETPVVTPIVDDDLDTEIEDLDELRPVDDEF